MPAPRSVLIDIHDRGLNPKAAHKSVDSSGRIKGVTVPDVKPEPTLIVKEKQSVKATKKADTKKADLEDVKTVASGEETVVAVSTEGAGSVEHKQPEKTVVETPATTRRRRTTTDST